MKHKILSLVLLDLMCSIGNVWADTEVTISPNSDASSAYYFAADGTAITSISGSGAKSAGYNSGNPKITVDGRNNPDASIIFTISSNITITSFKVNLNKSSSNVIYTLDATAVTSGTALTGLTKTGNMTFLMHCSDAASSSSNRNTEITSFVITYTTSGGGVTPTAATPTISPANGSTFAGASQEITLSCETESATIYYTLDGTTPTESSNEYDEDAKPTISSTTTIKAIAVKAGYDSSEVASATIKKVVSSVIASWYFTSWSSETVVGVEADGANWYNKEADGDNKLDFTSEGHIGRSNLLALDASTLVFGSTNILETEGLKFTAPSKNMALMFDQPSALGDYNGSEYIWLYGKNAKIIIPSVPAGATIAIGVETHKTSTGNDGRGVDLSGPSGITLTKGIAKPTGYSDNEWSIPNAGDVTITPNVGGCHIYYITVTANVETVPVTKRNDRTYGTFVAPSGLDFSGVDNMEAYIAKTINGTTSVSIEKVTKVPAGTAFIVKTDDTSVDLANVPVTTSATASDVAGNLLVAGDGATTANSDYYYLAEDKFHLATEGTIQSGKAYLPVASVGGAPGLLRIVEGESNATAIEAIESNELAVKFFENGNLYIMRNGITYDALGRVVR